jgi:UDP-N-acetylglucosamine transferase subunit ALG13
LRSILKFNNTITKSTKILLVPLDWGLGHATRCIPIIKELLALKYEVIIAATGDQKSLLAAEFPDLRLVEIPGYELKYGKTKVLTILKIITGIPKILIQIKREKRWLRQFSAKERLDIVISDNRYGLYEKGLFSVFITHQLYIKTPLGRIAEWILQQINYHYINRFDICWVPDLKKGVSLAGELSHPAKLPSIPIRYIGVLSRFERERGSDGGSLESAGYVISEYYDLLILLSGPEPQRTIFEQLILNQIVACSGKAGKIILVRGLPGSRELIPVPPDVEVYNHLPAAALNLALSRAGLVISRAGYSTVMDLVKLGKKSILVPTPGQSEQEYLGEYLTRERIAMCMRQEEFCLPDALDAATDFRYAVPVVSGAIDNGLIQKEIEALLKRKQPLTGF